MRVLLLRRHERGELAAIADDWAATLPAYGITAVVHEAGSWIPEAVNRTIDRRVATELRALGEDFDIVIAMGYRAAWACAETWDDREVWGWFAYETPRVVHPFLVERLNRATLRFAASRWLTRRLEDAGVDGIEILNPGYALIEGNKRTPAEVRGYFELAAEGPLVGVSFGLPSAFATAVESNVESVLGAWPGVLDRHPRATLALLGEGERPEMAGVSFIGPIRRGAEFIAACDLWIEPARDRAWSRTLTVAMAHGVPTLVRDDGGFPEQAASEVSAFFFSNDSELEERIAEILEMELSREAVGNAARVRFEESHAIRRSTEQLAEALREIERGIP